MPTDVSDHASNANEQIDHAARLIRGSSLRRKVFASIYHGKKRVKTVGEIATKEKLDRKQDLNEGRKLANAKIVMQTKQDGDTAYEKIDSYHYHKAKTLRLASNPTDLESFPTKRKPVMGTHLVTIRLDTRRA